MSDNNFHFPGKNSAIFLVAVFLISLIIFLSFSLSRERIDAELSDPFIYSRKQDEVYKVHESMEISQEFIASHNNLHRVGVFAVNFYPQNEGWAKLVLTKGEEIIAERTISLFGLARARFFTLDFPPLDDSKDNQYILSFSTDAAEEKPVSIFADAFEGDGGMMVGGEEVGLRMTFITAYTNKDAGFVHGSGFFSIIDRVKQYKPYFFKGSAFYGIMAVYIIVLTVFIYYFIVKDA